MASTEAAPARGRAGRPADPSGVGGWLLLRRVLLVALASMLTVAGLLVLLSWVALRVHWHVPDPAVLAGPSEVRGADGALLARFSSEVDAREVELEEVSDAAVDAVLASEDARFYEHGGVDPAGLLRAVAINVRTGGITQGGSTLTQQYVKNAFVGDERTVLRKVREAVISIQLERDLPKDEILARYLNTVYFGAGAYGIEAAARTYFGVPARELDAAQGALLAQLLPAPSDRNPRVDPTGARQRADDVVERMGSLGMLTPGEVGAALGQEVEVVEPRDATAKAPFFVAYVRKQLVHAYGEQAVLTGGLTVRTTLDLDAQKALDRTIAERLRGERPVQAGAVALEPATGNIRAIHGGRNFDKHEFDLATQSRRQNGSALKPFVYTAALEEGIEPDEVLPAPSAITIPPSDCKGHDGKAISVAGGPGGSTTITEGLVASINTVYQQLGCRVGANRMLDTAERMGVRNRVSNNASVALGGTRHGASVLDLASAYGTLANDGIACPARSILEVRGPEDERLDLPEERTVVPGMKPRSRTLSKKELKARPEGLGERDGPSGDGRHAADCVDAVDPNVARTTTEALEQVVARGTGRRAAIGRPQAGKTGTTTDEKDAWFAGYTPHLSLAVWLGDPDFDGNGVKPMVDVAGFDRIQGGTLPARIWSDAAPKLLRDAPRTAFLEPGELPDPDAPDGPFPAPARDRPVPDATPSTAPPTAPPTEPSEPEESPDDEPTTGPDNEPDASPSPTETEQDDDEDDDDCIPLFCD